MEKIVNALIMLVVLAVGLPCGWQVAEWAAKSRAERLGVEKAHRDEVHVLRSRLAMVKGQVERRDNANDVLVEEIGKRAIRHREDLLYLNLELAEARKKACRCGPDCPWEGDE